MNNISIYNFDNLPSTNEWAKENLNKLSKTKINFITANQQTNGQGSHGRSWESPLGGIYCTICFHNDKCGNPTTITLASAVTICSYFESIGIKLNIKWPNDIICNNKKIGGILSEYSDNWLIVGFGLNINLSKDNLIDINRPIFPATSLKIEGFNNLNCIKILHELYEYFTKEILKWNESGISKFIDGYEKYNILTDKNLLINVNNEKVTGKYKELGSEGELIILDNHTSKKIFCGEILKLE